MKTLFLVVFLVTSISSFAFGETVNCVQVANSWFIKNSAGKIIGSAANGFANEAHCKETIAISLHGDLVCGWNDHKYQPYNIKNGIAIGSAGKPQDYYEGSADCGAETKMQPLQSEAVCGWGGGYYHPFNLLTGRRIGGDGGYGWKTMQECVRDSVSQAKSGLICGWAGAYFLYNMDGKLVSSRFFSGDACHSFLKMAAEKGPVFLKALKENESSVKVPEKPLPFVSDTPDETVGFTEWKKCSTAAHAFHMTKNVDGFIVPECSPDTLYSWGGTDKLKWYADTLKDGSAWPEKLPRALFTSHSAAGSFGYGQVPLRFKIKPHVKIKLAYNLAGFTCADHVNSGFIKSEDLKTTIIGRVNNRSDGFSFMEYIICSANVIESWSYVSKEHFDEILKDYNWMTTKDFKDWDAYSKRSGKDDFVGNNVDANELGTDFRPEAYAHRMSFLRFLTENSFGQVSAPAGAADAKAKHFQTAKPIYFNPK